MVKKSLRQMPYSQAQSLFTIYGAANRCEFSRSLISNGIVYTEHRWESTTLTVAYDTSMEAIENLKSKINIYVNANNRDWSGFSLNIDKMEYQNAISLVVSMERTYWVFSSPFIFSIPIPIPIDRPNWQDWGGRWTRRTAFMRHLKTVLEELDIRYTMPVQPVLLPKGDASYRPSAPIIQSPPPSRHHIDPSMLGNAGSYQAGELSRPSGPSFTSGVPTF